MSDIFNEIQNDIRRDRLNDFWRRYGVLLVIGAVIFVGAIAGWRLYEYFGEQNAQAAGDRFQQALTLSRDGKHAEAETAMQQIAADAPSGYAALARFAAAAELAPRDPAVAAQRFDALSREGNVEQGLRDLARLRAAMLLVDTQPPAEIANRVEALAAPGNVWRHTAREIMALAHLRAGDGAEAQRWAQALVSDPEVPQGSRARGQILLDLAAEPMGAAAEKSAQ